MVGVFMITAEYLPEEDSQKARSLGVNTVVSKKYMST